MKHAGDHRARAAEQSHIHDRREPAGEVDREQEQRYPRRGGRAREQRVQVEAQAARDEEHRDEYAECGGLELQPELGMGRLVAVDQRQQNAGGKRSEDGLQPELVGERGKS